MAKITKATEKELLGQLHDGLVARAQAKHMEDEAKTLKGEADKKIELACALLGYKNYQEEGVGVVTPKIGVNVSINKEKLTTALLELGVSYKTVTEALERGTQRTQYSYVEFRRSKM